MLAYIATGTFYSATEAGFRMLTPSWIFLLLAVLSSSGVVLGLFSGEAPKVIASGSGPANKTLVTGKITPERESVHSARRRLTQFEISRANNIRS